MPKRQKATATRHFLARNLKYARNMKGWSQEQLAERSGLHRNIIGVIERGEIGPTVDTLHWIGRGLSIESHLLLMSPAEAQPRILAVLDKR